MITECPFQKLPVSIQIFAITSDRNRLLATLGIRGCDGVILVAEIDDGRQKTWATTQLGSRAPLLEQMNRLHALFGSCLSPHHSRSPQKSRSSFNGLGC